MEKLDAFEDNLVKIVQDVQSRNAPKELQDTAQAGHDNGQEIEEHNRTR